jgi:hypothetical protein
MQKETDQIKVIKEATKEQKEKLYLQNRNLQSKQ